MTYSLQPTARQRETSSDLRILYRNLLTPIPLRRRTCTSNRRARGARPSRPAQETRAVVGPHRVPSWHWAVRTGQATPSAEGGRAVPSTARKHGSQAEQDVRMRTSPPPKRAPGRTRGGEPYSTPQLYVRASSTRRCTENPKRPRASTADCAHGAPDGTPRGPDHTPWVPTLALGPNTLYVLHAYGTAGRWSSCPASSRPRPPGPRGWRWACQGVS